MKSRSGRPYNSLLFNIHKLIALAGVIIIALKLIKVFRSVDPSALLTALLVLAALSTLAQFVSGALMSAGKLDHALMHMIHRVAILSLVASLLAVVYLIG